ncbi:unnamed protein product [Prunus brigantina]
MKKLVLPPLPLYLLPLFRQISFNTKEIRKENKNNFLLHFHAISQKNMHLFFFF